MHSNTDWDELTIEEKWAHVAGHYADVVDASLATVRTSLAAEPEPGRSRLAMLRWFAKNLQEQGAAMEARLIELGGILPDEIPDPPSR